MPEKLLDKYQWYDADINTNGNDPTSSKTCICFTIDTFNKMESEIEKLQKENEKLTKINAELERQLREKWNEKERLQWKAFLEMIEREFRG